MPKPPIETDRRRPLPPDVLYAELARLAGGLASPTRLRALHLVFQGEKSIDQLAALLGESTANTAAHMKALRAAGLISARRQGKYVYQQAAHPSVVRLFLALREAGEALAPALRLHDPMDDDDASPVTLDELEEQTAPRRALLIDLRPAPEYQAGHLPGALSLPLPELDARLPGLPARRRLLVYCRGKYCPDARRGAHQLRHAGLRAERLLFGVPEWCASGRALAVGGAQ